MFAKANGSTIGETPWCYWCIYCQTVSSMMFAKTIWIDSWINNLMLFDIFSADFASIMFAKTNESTVG